MLPEGSLQQFAQPFASAVQPLAQALRTAAEPRGQLLCGVALHIVQPHQRAGVRGELLQRPADYCLLLQRRLAPPPCQSAFSSGMVG
jgi:uncharacterized protein (DUF3084 family)